MRQAELLREERTGRMQNVLLVCHRVPRQQQKVSFQALDTYMDDGRTYPQTTDNHVHTPSCVGCSKAQETRLHVQYVPETGQSILNSRHGGPLHEALRREGCVHPSGHLNGKQVSINGWEGDQ